MPDGARPTPGLPPPRPIPLKGRASILFVERGQLDVVDGAFVVLDVRGVRTVIPVGGIACLMLEPGTRTSHAAVVLAARAGTLLIWVGEAGVRLYATGRPDGARSDRLLYQARLVLDDDARLRVVRRMYAIRFGEDPPARRSVDQLRSIEGTRVRELYKLMAQQYGVRWNGRRYDPQDWGGADVVTRCLSAATSALYGLSEAAVLAAGTPQPSASCTPARRRASSTTSPTCSSSKRWCPKRSAWWPRCKRAGCWRASPSQTRWRPCAAVAVTLSGAWGCWPS